MRTLKTSIINAWAEELEKDLDAFLDFAESLHISESCTQGGERVLYFENGMYYLGRGFRMGENDGEAQKAIIEELEACGLEFKKRLLKNGPGAGPFLVDHIRGL